jgi:hypothetical protein
MKRIRHPSETARTLPNAHPVIGSRGDSRDTGMSAAEMRERAARWRDEQPQVTLCALCGWRFEGSVGEGREAAREHRLAVHPGVRPVRRRGSSIRRLERDEVARQAAIAKRREAA